jgi:hypothetical protein
MNRKCIFFAVCVVLILLSEAWPQTSLKPIGPEAFQVLQRMHGYDKELPLDPSITQSRRWNRADGIFERIVFTTFDGTPVPLVLVYPTERKQPVPCVLLLHGLGGRDTLLCTLYQELPLPNLDGAG